MHIRFHFFLLVLSLLMSTMTWGQEKKNAFITKDLLPDTDITEAKISTQGTWIAYVENSQGQASVKFLFTKTREEKSTDFSSAIGTIEQLEWLDDDQFVIVQKHEKMKGSYLWLYSINKAAISSISKEGDICTLVNVQQGANPHLTFTSQNTETGLFSIHRFSAPFEYADPIYKSSTVFTHVITDTEGLPLAALSDEGKSKRLHFTTPEGLLANSFMVSTENMVLPLAAHPEKNLFYASSNRGREYFALVAYDPVQQTEREVLHQQNGCDLLHLALDQKGLPLYAEYNDGTGHTQYCFNPSLKKEIGWMNGSIESAFSIQNTTIDGELYLVKTKSPIRRHSFVLYNKSTQQPTFLFGALKEDRLEKRKYAKQIPISYTLPQGGQTTALFCYNASAIDPDRVIVLLNESVYTPWEQDFQPSLQMIASQGIHVLAVNTPGTFGRGQSVATAQGQEPAVFLNACITSAIDAVNKEMGLTLSKITYGVFGNGALDLATELSNNPDTKIKLFIGLTGRDVFLQEKQDMSCYSLLSQAFPTFRKNLDKKETMTERPFVLSPNTMARCAFGNGATPPEVDATSSLKFQEINSETSLLFWEKMLDSLVIYALTK